MIKSPSENDTVQEKGPRPFSVDDLCQIRYANSPQLSPDGKLIAGVISLTDFFLNIVIDNIVLIDAQDKKIEFLAEGHSPSWSPDGQQLAYECGEGDLSAIWLFNLKRREKRRLVTVYHSEYFMSHLAEKAFAWSPDGNYIAYVGTYPSAQKELEEIHVITRLLYKTKGGRGRHPFSDDSLTHIWCISATGGAPFIITPGNYNEHSICWSPDSCQIAFISNRTGDPDANNQSDLWTVNVQTKEIRRLTSGPGTRYKPRWSPDGNYLAYLATASEVSSKDSPADDTQVYLVAAQGGDGRCLTTALDRRTDQIRWHPNAPLIYFTAGNEGATAVYCVSLSGEIQPIVQGAFHVSEYSLSTAGEDLVFVKTDVAHPPELFLHRQRDNTTLQITHQNASVNSQCIFSDAEMFWYASFDQTRIQGWIIKPSLFYPAEKYPLVLVIHGGPHNMFGYEFEERMQLLAGQGYGVVFINPRGSNGYGQSFSNGCVMDWGGNDYKDLMAGLDYVIDRYTWIDGVKLGITGQSYGGYMTNWAITQTNRFNAAVVDGGISNLISFAGTSLYRCLVEAELNGNPWDNYPLLWQSSPLRNVNYVTTPTLFLHGETDNEVPVSQAEEMYSALKKSGVETRLIRYAGEGHGWRPDLTPRNRHDLYQRMLYWFERYIR